MWRKNHCAGMYKTKSIKTGKSNLAGTGNQDYAFFISDIEENIWIQLIVEGVRSTLVQQTKWWMKIPGHFSIQNTQNVGIVQT